MHVKQFESPMWMFMLHKLDVVMARFSLDANGGVQRAIAIWALSAIFAQPLLSMKRSSAPGCGAAFNVWVIPGRCSKQACRRPESTTPSTVIIRKV